MPTTGWKKLSDDEIRLAKTWFEDCVEPSEIAERLGRDKSTITRLCVKMVPRKKQGRKKTLSEAQVDFLEHRLDQLIKKAKGQYHITSHTLKRSTRLQVSVRTILDALHERNVYFRKLREKPILSEDDVKSRLEFARAHKDKTPLWWNSHVHSYIDGKHFKVYLNGTERLIAAQHATYGAYRKPGKGLHGAYVKPKKTLKRNTGAASCLVMAGIGGGKTMMWHYIDKSRWNGAEAANMYTGPLTRALKRQWPASRKWHVLEDNDPTGFKSGAAVRAKAEAGIQVFALPPRSPDLNPCDYALWTEINRRMRKQEMGWRASRRESRGAYMKRLQHTAVHLPHTFIERAIGDMARRCKRLYMARGHHFEEGGKGR